MSEQPGRRSGSVPTIRDVARAAGVSPMTVSRVINGEAMVRPATRTAVEAAIRTLNYVPNPLARALSGGEHVRVALLHRFPNPGSLGEYLVFLLDQSTKAHASLIVRKVASDAEDEAAVRELVADGVRGVILAPPLADDQRLVALLRSTGIAMVATGSTHLHGEMASVGIDDRGAARTMAEHLLSLGHRRIGFIQGHPSHASTEFRLEGFRAALAQAGIAVDPELIAQGRYTYHSGLDAAEQLLNLVHPPTAIFASNDDMAAATVAVAHGRGIDVPADLSVCGFDDTTLATAIWPALTTIGQPMQDVTRVAFDLLLREVSSGRHGDPAETGEQVVLGHLLVRRQSDAAPREVSGTVDG